MTAVPDMPIAPRLEPLFLPVEGRRVFALRFHAVGESRGGVLYVPPFAEEMNRLRAVVAEQATALARQGFDCLLVDPSGTGDSSGDLTEATWDDWVSDISAACDWFAGQLHRPPVLWGCRTGALLAASVAHADPSRCAGLLFWQPVVDGKIFINQHLRLRVAANIVRDSAGETTQQIRQRLNDGEVIEVAGYDLTGPLVAGIEAQRLVDTIARPDLHIHWIDIVSEGGEISPGNQRVIDKLRSAGATVDAHPVVAPLMWQVYERESAPNLVALTTAVLKGEAA